ncbi:MAG: LOG family protein [Caulobacteraceae bacterium]|nr:LOG family protein [Caulobacteraceae bacterium]
MQARQPSASTSASRTNKNPTPTQRRSLRSTSTISRCEMHLAMRANGLVVFPGGFGTLDEMFEILTLRQTRKAPLIPVVLFDEAYWRSVINFDKLVEHGAIDAADLTLFRFADTAEATWDALVEQGLGKAPDDSAPDVVQKDI